MNNMETIAAIATPVGAGGISVIRISGKNSLNIANDIFYCKTTPVNFEARKMYLGKIKTEEFTEQCLCVYFKAPYSYTGEDVVEFQIHGGILITKKVLQLILNKGAKLAEPGEFTKRAFLNGKISLEGAEAVIDTINANSDAELSSASILMNGALSEKLENLQNKLTNTIAQIEVAIDYPEHDIEYITAQNVKEEILFVISEVQKLIESNIQGRIIKDGINIALIGVPNVGKSSLMNALLEYDRAIVTDIAGTTRDTLNESFIYKGVRINLIDTAGIRDSADTVESIGIKRSWDAVNRADLVLYLIDNSKEKLSNEEIENLNNIKKDKIILVKNKSDIKSANIINPLNDYESIEISAKDKTGIEELKELIYNKTFTTPLSNSALYITNERHKILLENAKCNLEKVLDAIEIGLSLDLVIIDIQNAWNDIGQITGKSYSIEVLNTIFSKFCLGK